MSFFSLLDSRRPVFRCSGEWDNTNIGSNGAGAANTTLVGNSYSEQATLVLETARKRKRSRNRKRKERARRRFSFKKKFCEEKKGEREYR